MLYGSNEFVFSKTEGFFLNAARNSPPRSVVQPSELSTLITTNEPKLRALIRRRAGRSVLNRVSLDDLFNEVIAEALSAAKSFEYQGDERFLRWMETITKRVMARAVEGPHFILTRLRSPDSLGTGVPAEDIPGNARTPSSIVNQRDERTLLYKAMDRLPQHYRQVLVLYAAERRPVSAIAAEIHRTEKATYGLLARATAALRECLRSPI